MHFTPVRTALVGVIVAALGAVSFTPSYAGAPQQDLGSDAGQPATHHAPASRVTLVTGDVVELTRGPDGTERAALVAGPGSASGAHGFTRAGDAYLVPASAEPLLAEDRLDLELFNISKLVKQGYAELPVIVDYPRHRKGGRSALPTPAGAERRHVLSSIDAVALAVDTDSHDRKVDPSAFWSDITTGSGRDFDKVWLDARVHATLDQSAAEIGAPAAWKRGFTGTGVKIATLDSGIDSTHPDFKGRIVGTADFTDGDSVEDRAGHGTHVASIAAGSGAASEGRYRGIAPDAELLVGKVLGDDGSGSMSSVIEGMEWAVESDADIVNMSLGGPVTKGDDPLSEAVNELTAEGDALFVVAAGNHEPHLPGMRFVSSPAAADASLAVGAVRRKGSLWDPSRRGRMDGDAIKPEITAPGFSITAAGASGAGLPDYVSQTGTSMAAPHVAGAAAVLKQEHPGWGAEELRDALTSTADPVDPRYSVYEQGAGEVDLDRATSQDVLVDAGVMHLGYFTRPYRDLTVARTLTYRNESSSAVDLEIGTALRAQQHDDVPDDALTVRRTSLHLAPGQARAVRLQLDARKLPADTYSGSVTAVGADVRVSTTVGFAKQDDMVDVTLRAIDRRGGAGTASVRIAPYKQRDNRYNPDYIYYLGPQQTEYTVRLPKGDYNVFAHVTTFDESGRFPEQESIVGDPRLKVRAPNFDITLDAREAVPVSLDTQRRSEPRRMTVTWWRGQPSTLNYTEDTWSWSFAGEPTRVSMTPTEAVADAPFGLVTSFDAGAPVLKTRAKGRSLDAVQVAGWSVDGRQRLPITDVGTASPEELAGTELSGRMALVLESPKATPSEQVRAAAEAGAEMVMLRSAQPGVFWPRYVNGPVPVLAVPRDDGAFLAERADGHRISVTMRGTARTPYAYDVNFSERGRVPADLTYRARQRDLARVRTRIYGTETGETGWRLHQFNLDSCDCGAPMVDDLVPTTGYTRTEYLTADADVSSVSAWQYWFGQPADVIYSRGDRTYRPREHVTEEWLKAPYSPGVPQSAIRAGGRSPVSTRDEDRLSYSLAAFTDSAGHWTPNFSPARASSRLYQDGKEIYATDYGLSGSATVPPAQATYRLEADVDHDGSQVGLSTRTRTAWTFRSADTATARPLPLIDVDYVDVRRSGTNRSALDLLNAARSGARVDLVLTADHQEGATAPPVRKMDVEVSYDDGATWEEVPVHADHETFVATYRHPQGSADHVSLRIHAHDGAGGRLEQTLIRAYRLR